MVALLLIALGAVLLYAGGEILVRSVCRLAATLNISPLVISLTVVAFGTSAPEVAVVVGAGIADRPAIALGNVLGSNIANLGLVLGLAALFHALVASRTFLRRDLPFMVGSAVILLPVAWLDGLGRPVAFVLLAVLMVYLWILFRGGDSQTQDADQPPGGAKGGLPGSLAALIAGLALLIFGAHILVEAAVDLALGMGVSERVVGLTIVAFGTSLPEVASCLVAALRRQGDVVLGNIIGSNVFNTLFVLPIGLLVLPVSATATQIVDIAVMIGASLLAFFFLYRRPHLGRVEGVVMLFGYVAYVVFLFTQGG